MLTATITSIKKQTPDTNSFILELDQGTMSFNPGQHIVIAFEKDGKKVFRTYSLTSLPKELPRFELCIKRYENGTASVYMNGREVNDKVTFNEPRGNLFLRHPGRENVFIATGTGITPMMAMIRQLLDGKTGNDIWLFFGVKGEQDIIFREEFGAMTKKNKDFHFIVSLSQPNEQWKGERGYVQECIEKYIKDFGNKDFYVCGVPKMVVQTIEKLKNLGVPHEQIFSEGWEIAAG